MKIGHSYREIDLDEAKVIMLDILLKFDKICKENNLTYWLTAGTLLGAVRHNGFIPWDDDIDVAMPRRDYNKFIQLDDYSKLFLQNKTTDLGFSQYWTKLRDKNSLYIEEDELNKTINYHQGIFIDIFPVNCINNKVMKFYPILQRTVGILSSSNRFYSKWTKYDFKLQAIKFLNLFDNQNNNIVIESIDTADTNIKAVPKNEIYPLDSIIFEEYQFSAPHNQAKYLKVFYGETYMELPPKEQRKIHHHKIYAKK